MKAEQGSTQRPDVDACGMGHCRRLRKETAESTLEHQLFTHHELADASV